MEGLTVANNNGGADEGGEILSRLSALSRRWASSGPHSEDRLLQEREQ